MKSEEYNALRNELLNYLNALHRTMLFSIISTSSILAILFGLDDGRKLSENPHLFLLPLIVIIPSCFRFSCSRAAVLKISTYIEVFWEKDKRGWESRARGFKKNNKLNNINWFIMQFIYTSVSPALGFLCCFLYKNFSKAFSVGDWLLLVVSIVLLGYSEISSILPTFKCKRESYVNKWKEILKIELAKRYIEDLLQEIPDKISAYEWQDLCLVVYSGRERREIVFSLEELIDDSQEGWNRLKMKVEGLHKEKREI